MNKRLARALRLRKKNITVELKAVSRIMLALLFLSTLTLAFNTKPARASIKVSDDFNDNSINSDLWSEWEVGGPTVNEINQRLEILLTWNSAGEYFGAGYGSKCWLRGDFDIQVDFSLLDWPSVDQLGTGNGVRIGLQVTEGENWWSVQREGYGSLTFDFPGYPREVYVCDFAGSVEGITPTDDMSGKLRLVRSGSTLTGYHFSSGSWVTVASGLVTTEDVWFSNSAWSHDYAFMDSSVWLAFDNFIVNSGRIAPPAGEAKGQQFPPAFLKGNKIGLYDSGYRAVPADQPSFVIHGFQNPNWPQDYSEQERNSLLRDYLFVLEIDGVTVKLRKWIHHYDTLDTYEDVMLVTFYMQFEANHFAVGTYTFRGVWYGPNMTVEYERIITVEFY